MEKEHKRKGCERNCDQEAKRRKKLRRVDEEEEAEAAGTEAEVEEFFAILRRMKAAIEYFSKGNDDSSNGEGWRAVEAEVAATVAVVGRGEREEEQETKVTGEDAAEEIDLNAVPEGDIDGGS